MWGQIVSAFYHNFGVMLFHLSHSCTSLAVKGNVDPFLRMSLLYLHFVCNWVHALQYLHLHLPDAQQLREQGDKETKPFSKPSPLLLRPKFYKSHSRRISHITCMQALHFNISVYRFWYIKEECEFSPCHILMVGCAWFDQHRRHASHLIEKGQERKTWVI